MKVKFSNNAIKSLNKLDAKNQERVRTKIYVLLTSLENQGVIPFTELDIKKLKGEWQGFYRIRIGQLRAIFSIDMNLEELLIYEIDFRGDIYKKN